MTGSPDAVVRFSQQDLELFSTASGDRNPLHMSVDYARRTAYGKPVVFGCLGALACAGRIPVPAASTISWVQAEFLRPMFVGVTYRVETSEADGYLAARLLDGSIPVVTVKVKTEPAAMEKFHADLAPAPVFQHDRAIARGEQDVVTGLEVSGTHSCDADSLAALSRRWGVGHRLLPVLCWSSYLVGMELPGESALFSKLLLRFQHPGRLSGMLRYRGSVEALDRQLGQVRLRFSLSSEDGAIACGQCWSYVRPALPDFEETTVAEYTTDSLAGRVAVVIGASRGLGAALKRTLESRGATVYSVSRSASKSPADHAEVGDATDPDVLLRLRERLLKEHGRLDFLIANACPPIPSLRMEPNSIQRIREYLDTATSITLSPLCVFLEPLNISGGSCVVISSAAVENPVRDWPHYIAAKQSVEMLARVGVMQHPRVRLVIARPPKLLTALTNTPMGRRGALLPEVFAGRVVECLENPPEPGKTVFVS